MSTFTLCSEHTLDVRLSVFCGQVFRWRELPTGTLLGVDGDTWWRIKTQGSELTCTGNGDVADLRRLFRMDEDWTAHESRVRQGAPELAPFMDALPGLRLLAPADPVEVAFCFLCTSNNHLTRITAMVERLASFGPELARVEGVSLHRFPSVERIAAIPESELRKMGFGYRGATIPEAARQVADRGGRGWLEGLRSKPLEESRRSLMELRGVGPKLADCVCLFALGHRDAVPVDTHVWQAAVRLWFPELRGKTLTRGRYEAVGAHLRSRLGPQSGWAHQFLFYENLLNWRSRAAAPK